MKSKSNRSITIETSRTVMVRQSSRRTHNQYSEYHGTTGAGNGITENRSYGPVKPWADAGEAAIGEIGFEPAFVASVAESVSAINGRGTRAYDRPNAGQNQFNDLFDWLSDDREVAGIRYEEIRRALIKLFVCRGVHMSEDLADETIDRVVRKLPEIRERYEGRPIDYFCGVAKKIYMEHSRKSVPRAFVPQPTVEVDEDEYIRLDHCLDKLAPEDRTLILEYYRGERQQKINSRKEIADRMGIPINALRIRAHRIRTQLMQMMMADKGVKQSFEM
jgi:RNA polymerase sigma factor (sigma-70 family)